MAALRVASLRRSAPVTAAAEASKRVLREVGVRTSDHRPPADMLIVGAKRGGTTSLFEYVAEHPGVLPLFPARRAKGTYFFTDHYDLGEAWWLSHFPTTWTRDLAQRRLGYRPVTAEASPYYLFHPLAPERAAQAAPHAVVVAILRNPIERAFSHYKERKRHTETLSFDDALAAEAERTAGEEERLVADPTYVSFAHRHQTYAAQSKYGPMLRRWSAAFPPEQMFVRTAEEFYADPQGTVDELVTLLGLPRIALADASPRNAAPSADMAAATRARLADEMAETVAEVDAYLGRPTGWT